jgi:DnaJ-class molecular chaperone
MNNKYITEKCDKCNGEGVLVTRFGLSVDVPESCWVCKGSGKLPNEEGRQILELIKLFGRRL